MRQKGIERKKLSSLRQELTDKAENHPLNSSELIYISRKLDKKIVKMMS